MSVSEFSELVIEMLGINNHDKVDDRVVLAAGDAIRGKILYERSKMGLGITGDFVKPFVVDIKSDSLGQYFHLPCQLCPIPENGAFRHIGPDLETGYIPLKPGTIATIAPLEIAGLAGQTGYLQIAQKVYLRYLPVPNPNELVTLLVPNMIWLFENGDDSDLIGDADIEAQLVEMCFNALVPKAQAMEDKQNDNKTTP